MNLRQPLPLLLLSLTLVAGATACDRTSGGTSARPQGAGSAEAERTHEMETKADEMDKRAEEIKNMEGSEQDKIDAVNKLEQDRQDLNATAEGGAGDGN